jgi:nitroreductase
MDLHLIEGLRTTGAARAFTDETVDEATVAAILDDARFAPSGGNRQPWRVCLVRAASARRQLGDLMQPVWDEYVARNAAGVPAFSTTSTPPSTPVARRRNPLIETIETVPAVLVIAVDLGRVAMMDAELDRPPVTGGASIYPFCWSILLAARTRGLGGVMTTFLARAEPAAAPALGLPAGHAIAAVLFLGHPEHQPTKLSRHPVAEFATLDRFDGPALTGP